jgi:hypothetical protein
MRRTCALLGMAFLFAAACARDLPSESGQNAPLPDSGTPAVGDAGSVTDGSPSDLDATTSDDAPIDDAPIGEASTSDTSADDAGLSDDDGSIPPNATIGSCDRGKWTVSASDSDPTNPAPYAVDGLPPTRWSTGVGQNGGQYFQIDFGGFVTVSKVTLDDSFGSYGQTDFPRGYDVLASYDGINFNKKLLSASYSDDAGAVVTADFTPHAARALRIQLTASSGSWWSIHELTLGCATPDPSDGGGSDASDGGSDAADDASDASDGSADGSIDASDAGSASDASDGGSDAGSADAGTNPNHGSWTGTASSTSTVGGDAVINAFDGNPATRWSSGKGQFGDEWLRIDLGQATTISQIWLDANATDYPSAYQLELSSDDLVYTPVAKGLGAAQTKIAFASQSARYARIKQIGTGYNFWWSVYEVTVIP